MTWKGGGQSTPKEAKDKEDTWYMWGLNQSSSRALLPTLGHPVVCQLPGSMKFLYLSPVECCLVLGVFQFSNFGFSVKAQSAHWNAKNERFILCPQKLRCVCVSDRFYGYTFPCVFSQQIDPPTRIAGRQPSRSRSFHIPPLPTRRALGAQFNPHKSPTKLIAHRHGHTWPSISVRFLSPWGLVLPLSGVLFFCSPRNAEMPIPAHIHVLRYLPVCSKNTRNLERQQFREA